MSKNKPIKVAYMVSHPIQYQTPLLKRLAKEPDIALEVFFWSDHSVKGYEDGGFGGVRVKWDVPLLDGYKYTFLPVVWRSTENSFWTPVNRGFYRALRRGQFDVVWLHGYWSLNSILIMLVAKVLGVPVLQRAEGTLDDRPRSGFRLVIKRLFFSLLRHLIHGVLPVSSRNREYWNHYLGPSFPAFMVPYTVDNNYFGEMAAQASKSREEFRAELNLETGRSVILYASKLMPRKRCIDLIEACVGLRTSPGNREPYLLIVGDGSERAACEARVRDAGATNIRFFGFQNQSQLAQFFDLCDVFVLPSVHEPFGLVVNEVMNAGRAIIVSDQVGCQRDLVEDGVNGKVFPAGDVSALRSTLESLLGNPETLRMMGRRSLERVNQWSFEEDIRGLRRALNHVAGLPLDPAHLPVRCGTVDPSISSMIQSPFESETVKSPTIKTSAH